MADLIAACVWTGGVLPSWYHERIGRAAVCAARDGHRGAKGGILYVLWHSGYPWAMKKTEDDTMSPKDESDHRREWDDIQRLAAEKAFTAIDLDPIIRGDTSDIGELGITVEGRERENLKAMLQAKKYSACKDHLALAALACKKDGDALCVFDVDFRFNPDVAMADFLDEKPRLRCNVAIQPDGSASLGHQFILLPPGVSNPWQQRFPTELNMTGDSPVLGIGSYADLLETTLLEGIDSGGYRGPEPSPLSRLHVQIGRFKRTETDVICIGTPLADMIATYEYKTDLSKDLRVAREVEHKDGIMLRQGEERDEAWLRDIMARYPPFRTQIDKLVEERHGERRNEIIEDLNRLYLVEHIDIPAMVRSRFGLEVETGAGGISKSLAQIAELRCTSGS